MHHTQPNTAIEIRGGFKSFGRKPVLNNLDMHVERGAIYGLLGSSGCGKTTLLSCIVGRKRLDSGHVWVLGGPPGTKESAVPGRRVGYMPQETALIAEFTVKTVIYYFGRIFCMSDYEIENKFKELSLLLDLPHADRFIAECSGGQQRRISFAAALVGTPELLVLDEPTVGLDPLLRDSIWNYLLKLTDSHLVTVIITTHYVEEAQKVHKVGFMRHGRLLAEESPEKLLQKFATSSLEDVFFTLCKNEERTLPETQKYESRENLDMDNLHSSSSTTILSYVGMSKEVLAPTSYKISSKTSHTANKYGLKSHRIKALLGKSWLQVAKNYSGIGFMFIFPIVQTLAFFLAIGDNLKDIKIAFSNQELDFDHCKNYIQNNSAIRTEDGVCEFHNLGCRFLQHLNDSMISGVYYDDVNKAQESIRHGKLTGALYIPENFTESLNGRVIFGDYDDITLENSQVQVQLDMSNGQIGNQIKAKLISKIIDFQKSLFEDCGILNRTAAIPINFSEYMYGHPEDTFTVFMVPGILITALYFLGASNAANIILTDRLEGIWDRSVVAGVSTLEIVLVHFLTQFIIVFIQSTISLVLTFVIYKTENLGNFVDIIIIVLLTGVSGITFGFCISVVSTSHSMSHTIVNGTLFPLIVLCGFMWPIEGMPKVLQYFALCLPVTLPIISLRNVMKRGWSLIHQGVIDGVVVQIIWIVVLLLITILEMKRKR